MKFLIVDFSALYRQNWHAAAAKEANAPLELTVGKIRRLAADYDRVAIALDSSRSRRKALSADYKAKRDPVPAACVDLAAKTVAVLRREGFPCFESDGDEGDDVVASFCRWGSGAAEHDGHDITILGSDKDLNQCLRSKYVTIMNAKGDVTTAETLFLKLGVHPWQFIDFQSLCGDPTDGVRGVKGCGEVNAAALLKEHGDLSGILKAALADPPGIKKPAMRAAIVDAIAWLDTTRELVTLRTDCPCDFSTVLAPRGQAKGTSHEGEGANDISERGNPRPRPTHQGGAEGPSPHERDREGGREGHEERQGLDEVEPARRDRVNSPESCEAEACQGPDCRVIMPAGEGVRIGGRLLCGACVGAASERQESGRATDAPRSRVTASDGPAPAASGSREIVPNGKQQQERPPMSNQGPPQNQQQNRQQEQGRPSPHQERANHIRRIFRERYKELAAVFPEDGETLVTRAQATACSVSMGLDINVTADSIASAAISCHHLGLDVGDQAYIYPFKMHGKLQARLTVGPRGLITLAYRSGFVRSVVARSVFQADVDAGLFDYDFGRDFITHKKAPKRRPHGVRVEDMVAFSYVIIETTTEGRVIEVLTREDIDFYRGFSKAESGPWFDNFEGMCRKTALKRGLEFVPRSPLLSQALKETDEGAYQLPENLAEIVDKAIRARDGKAPKAPAMPQQEQRQQGGEEEQEQARGDAGNVGGAA